MKLEDEIRKLKGVISAQKQFQDDVILQRGGSNGDMQGLDNNSV